MTAELEAEICFLNPESMRETVELLTAQGFECHAMSWTDPLSSKTRWIQATIETDLTVWKSSIV